MRQPITFASFSDAAAEAYISFNIGVSRELLCFGAQKGGAVRLLT